MHLIACGGALRDQPIGGHDGGKEGVDDRLCARGVLGRNDHASRAALQEGRGGGWVSWEGDHSHQQKD